jgi:hypothetical protein
MDTMPKDKDTDNPRKDYMGFLKTIGVTKADFRYFNPDISGHPGLEHDEDGNAYGRDIDVDRAPDELTVRPAEIDFCPTPEVEDIFYRLYVGKGIVEIQGDSDWLDYLGPNRKPKIEVETDKLVAAAETFAKLQAFHEKVREAAEKFGFRLSDY